MVRVLLGAAIVLGIVVTLFYSRAQPTTTLVDAAGASLTAKSASPRDEGLYAEIDAAIEAGKFEEAKSRLVALLETSESDGETCLRLARVCRELEEADEAVDFGLKAVELCPDSGAARHAYAQALAAKMLLGKSKLAALALVPRWKEAIAQAIALDPTNVEARVEEIAFLTFMPGMIGGDTDRALERAADLVSVDERAGRLWRIRILDERDEDERAMELCRGFEQQDPGDAMLPFTLGTILLEHDDLTGAREAFARARSLDRGEAYYRSLSAESEALLDHGVEPERALALAEEYLAADPDFPMMAPKSLLLYRKGVALERLGRIDEAREAYRESSAGDPPIEQAREALARLGS